MTNGFYFEFIPSLSAPSKKSDGALTDGITPSPFIPSLKNDGARSDGTPKTHTIMKDLGITQKDLADFLGISRSHLSTSASRKTPLPEEASYLLYFLQHCQHAINQDQLETVATLHQHNTKTEEQRYRLKRTQTLQVKIEQEKRKLQIMESGYQHAIKLKCLATLAIEQLPLSITNRAIRLEILRLQQIKSELALNQYAEWKQLKLRGTIIALEAELQFLTQSGV